MQVISALVGSHMVGDGGSGQKEKGSDAAQAYVIVVTNDRLLNIALVDGDGVMVREFFDAPARLCIEDASMGTRDGWVGEYNIVCRVAANGDSYFGELEASARLSAGKNGNLAQAWYVLVGHAQSPTCFVHD